eukprot:GEMP01019056.1.p1 GENE.GEMP01019056.1~~GEMP01019056.1.p1  ORF type:complete len:656 (+),score=199.68 GEMP01019056.1:140-2107(+)
MITMRKTRSEGTLPPPASAKKFAPTTRRLPLATFSLRKSVLGPSLAERTSSEQRTSLKEQRTSSEQRVSPKEQRTPIKQRVFGRSAAQDDSLTIMPAATTNLMVAVQACTRNTTIPRSDILRKNAGENVAKQCADPCDSVRAMKAAVRYADAVTQKTRLVQSQQSVQEAAGPADPRNVGVVVPQNSRNNRLPSTTNAGVRAVDAATQKEQEQDQQSVQGAAGPVDPRNAGVVLRQNSTASSVASAKIDSASAAHRRKCLQGALSSTSKASHASDSSAETTRRELKVRGHTPTTGDDAAPERDSTTNNSTSSGVWYRDGKAGNARTSKLQEAKKAGPCQKGLMQELQSLERKCRILQTDLTQERRRKAESEAMYKRESEVARDQMQIAEDATHQTLLARKASATEIKNLADELEFLKKSSKEKEEALRAELDAKQEEHVTEKEILKVVSAKNLKEVKKRQFDTKKHMASKEEVAHGQIAELTSALLNTKQKLKLAKQAYLREERTRRVVEHSLERAKEAAVKLGTEGQRVAGELEITALKLRVSEKMCRRYEEGSFDAPVDSSNNDAIEQQQLEMKSEVADLRLELTGEKEKSEAYARHVQEASETLQQLLRTLKEVEFQRDQHALNLEVAEETMRMNLMTQRDIHTYISQYAQKS